jgi:enamine deaminase RidA (YjgF/YER057c/UK114 family)
VSRVEPVLPKGWPRPSGYSNGALASGRILAIAGQIGWNPLSQTIEVDDFVEQARQALLNIKSVLQSAGGSPRDVIRLTWYITDRSTYLRHTADLGTAYRDIFGDHYPAMAVLVVAGFLEQRALLEIEATAVLPG